MPIDPHDVSTWEVSSRLAPPGVSLRDAITAMLAHANATGESVTIDAWSKYDSQDYEPIIVKPGDDIEKLLNAWKDQII